MEEKLGSLLSQKALRAHWVCLSESPLLMVTQRVSLIRYGWPLVGSRFPDLELLELLTDPDADPGPAWDLACCCWLAAPLESLSHWR